MYNEVLQLTMTSKTRVSQTVGDHSSGHDSIKNWIRHNVPVHSTERGHMHSLASRTLRPRVSGRVVVSSEVSSISIVYFPGFALLSGVWKQIDSK